MAVNVYFDGTLIDSDSVIGLNQSGEGFSGTFALGNTICRAVELEVIKSAVVNHPTTVTIYNDSTLYLTLSVYKVDETYDEYYKYYLTDSMIKFNKVIEFSDGTAQSALNTICNGICTVPTISYGGAIPVSYSSHYSAREFIGYIAELQGGYAYIDANNALVFAPFSNTSSATITLSDISGYTLGQQITINKTIYESGTSVIEYGSGDSPVYLNPDNVLITDSGSWTRQGIVDHIGAIVNGLSFYNMSINYINPEVLPYNVVPNTAITVDSKRTLWQINLEYNGGWLGGHELNVSTSYDSYTTVLANDNSAKVKQIKITVDQQQGQIDQVVEDVEELDDEVTDHESRITQNASSISTEVTNRTNADTALSSRITQNADNITTEVTNRTNGDNSLSSRIEQCAESITLSVGTSSGKSTGITITTTKEDGSTETSSGTITLSGDVVVKSNLTDGTTTISGDNITTGTIDASQATISNINASNINSGTLSADRISAGTITANKLKVNGETVGSSSNKYTRLFTTNLSVIDGSIYIATSAGVGVTLSNTGVSTTTGYSDTWADIITKTATFG